MHQSIDEKIKANRTEKAKRDKKREKIGYNRKQAREEKRSH